MRNYVPAVDLPQVVSFIWGVFSFRHLFLDQSSYHFGGLKRGAWKFPVPKPSASRPVERMAAASYLRAISFWIG